MKPLLHALKVFAACLAAAAAFAAGAEEIRFTDMVGESIRLARPAERTVTTPMPASAIFMAVDGGPARLVGMHPSAYDNLEHMVLPEIFPQVRQVRHDITRGGFAPNVESLLQIQPDIVWQWGAMGDELLTPIRNAGLTAAAIRYGKEEEVQRWIEMFAISVGKPARGAEINAWRKQVEARVRAQAATVPQRERLSIMYMTRYKTGMGAAGYASNFQFDSEVAGAINVNNLQTGAPAVNVEQVLVWNPDVIVLTNFETDLTPETLYRDPQLASVSAVRNRRVYKVPAGGYYWDPPSQDSPFYWIWLARLLYPNHVTLDMREELRQGYRLLYGYDISDALIDRALHWDVNQGSANYAAAFGPSRAAASR